MLRDVGTAICNLSDTRFLYHTSDHAPKTRNESAAPSIAGPSIAPMAMRIDGLKVSAEPSGPLDGHRFSSSCGVASSSAEATSPLGRLFVSEWAVGGSPLTPRHGRRPDTPLPMSRSPGRRPYVPVYAA